jgi:hypothetical protein
MLPQAIPQPLENLRYGQKKAVVRFRYLQSSFSAIPTPLTMILTLITLDGLGQCHTLLCDFVSLQAVSRGSLLPVVSNVYGQAANRSLGYARICYKLMDSFDVLASFLVLASHWELVSAIDPLVFS